MGEGGREGGVSKRRERGRVWGSIVGSGGWGEGDASMVMLPTHLMGVNVLKVHSNMLLVFFFLLS